MNTLYKYICLGMAFLASSSSFADSSDVSQSKQSQTQSNSAMKKSNQAPAFEQGMGLPDNKYSAGYNAPAYINVKNGWDFDLFGSFIFWHASQENMDLAYVTPSPVAGAPVSGVVAFQRVNYEPGFKVGFGFNTNYDGWVFRGEYTWLHQKISTSPTTPTSSGGTWTANDWFTYSDTDVTPSVPNTGASVSSSWKMHLDMVDAVFERPFYEGTQLVVTPYGGLRGLWIRQNFNIDLLTTTGAVNAYSYNSSSCWSVGPTTGVGGHWMLGGGFRFEGNAAASILYTQYTKISHAEQDSATLLAGAVAVSSTMRDLNVLRPVGQLAVGLGWGTYCCDNEYYFDISADYEFVYFWDQNVMRDWVGLIQGYPDPVSDLQMHGLTATLSFDF